MLSAAGDAEGWPADERIRVEGMTVRRLVAMGVVCGAEVSTVPAGVTDEEKEEIVDESSAYSVGSCDRIDVEDDDEGDVEVGGDAELGLEIPIVAGRKIFFFEAQQSCELSMPQHQLPSSSHSDIWLSDEGLLPSCSLDEPRSTFCSVHTYGCIGTYVL